MTDLRARLTAMSETWDVSADNCRRTGDEAAARLLAACAAELRRLAESGQEEDACLRGCSGIRVATGNASSKGARP